MQTYNIKPSLVTVAEQQISCLQLGEKGRGRVSKMIKCPADKTQLVVVSPKPGMPGNVRLVAGDTPGLLARISTEGAYIRNANGNVSVCPSAGESVQVVARGQGAFGDAGRIGTWDDVLLQITAPCTLRVKPSRGNAYLLVVNESFAVSKLTYEEAELVDIDVAGSSPTSRGEFVRL